MKVYRNDILKVTPQGFAIELNRHKLYDVTYEAFNFYDSPNYLQAELVINLLLPLPTFYTRNHVDHSYRVQSVNREAIFALVGKFDKVTVNSELPLRLAAIPVTAYHTDGTSFQTFVGMTRGRYSLVLSDHIEITSWGTTFNRYAIVDTATMQVATVKGYVLDKIELNIAICILIELAEGSFQSLDDLMNGVSFTLESHRNREWEHLKRLGLPMPYTLTI